MAKIRDPRIFPSGSISRAATFGRSRFGRNFRIWANLRQNGRSATGIATDEGQRVADIAGGYSENPDVSPLNFGDPAPRRRREGRGSECSGEFSLSTGAASSDELSAKIRYRPKAHMGPADFADFGLHADCGGLALSAMQIATDLISCRFFSWAARKADRALPPQGRGYLIVRNAITIRR